MKTLDVETMRKSKENLLRKKANFFSLVKKKKKKKGRGQGDEASFLYIAVNFTLK